MKNNSKYCSMFNLDASETVAYNNPLFPAYVRYGFLSSYPDYSAISHWHKDLEFILITKGKMTYNVNGELIELSKGNGIMVNSRQLHYGFSAKHNECEFICILLSPELLEGNKWFYQNYVENVIDNPSFPYLYLDGSDWQVSILAKLDKIYNYFDDTPGDTLSYFNIIEDFTFMLKTLYKNLPVENHTLKKESSDLASLRGMIAHIENHFTEHITLEEIALSGACCKSRCSLLFKKYLCDTPITYITKLRLRKSLAALIESDKTITDIAYEYGFGGISYYCETFKKYYGVSPLMYRKTHAIELPSQQ